jgi:small subunit ribosomal protein S11
VVVYRLVFKVTRNNVFITVIDPLGRYVFYSSGGLNYFFLRRRSVSVANILLGENIGSELRHKYISAVDLEFHGLPFKSHRWNFIKGLVASKVLIRNIVDKTPIAHNGCSRKKRRRKKLKRH